MRHGRGASLTITVATAALLVTVFGTQAAMLYLLQCGIIGLLLPELLARGFGSARAIAWTTAANLVVILAAVLAFALISGKNVHLLAVGEIKSSFTQALDFYVKSGVKGDDLAALKQFMDTAADLMVRIYPALMTVVLITVSGCSLSLARRFVIRPDSGLDLGEFKRFKNPEWMVWLLIAAGFSMLADQPIVTTPALNLLVVLAVLYFLQGLAVVSAIIARLSYAGMLRLGLYLILIFQPYVSALLVAVGIFDLWGDFRTPRKQENL